MNVTLNIKSGWLESFVVGMFLVILGVITYKILSDKTDLHWSIYLLVLGLCTFLCFIYYVCLKNYRDLSMKAVELLIEEKKRMDEAEKREKEDLKCAMAEKERMIHELSIIVLRNIGEFGGR